MNSVMRILSISAFFALCWIAVLTEADAEPQKTPLGSVDLISEVASLPADGGTITLGLYIDPDEGWHTYWKNPGDAGLPPKVTWRLPEEFFAAEFEFPVPHLIPFGPLNTYGYDEPTLLLTQLSIPAGLTVGDRVRIAGTADWVVCDDELCVPEKAEVEVTLTVNDGSHDASVSSRFDQARSMLADSVDWAAGFELLNERVIVSVQTSEKIDGTKDFYMFPGAKRVTKYDEQIVSFTPFGVSVSMPAHRRAEQANELPVLLTFTNEAGDRRSVEFLAIRGAAVGVTPVGASGAAFSFGNFNFGTAMLFAFLGGIILNLMPCVFPILSIKALSLVKVAQTDYRAAVESGVMYTAGILVAFALVGAALLSLRFGGQAVGWGFQMQYPIVNLGLGLLMLVIALNLLGVFEIGSSLMGVGQQYVQGGERKAAFFTGLLAVVVATPCAAPFMGTALGFALTQPAIVAMLVFLSLGFGLAFPYLVLSLVPSLGRMMPKPGPWMVNLRQVLAFPMMATAIWLFWVLGKQTDVNILALALLSALFLALCLWAFGRLESATQKTGWIALSVLGFISSGYFVYLVQTTDRTFGGQIADAGPRQLGGLELEHFEPANLETYVSEGQRAFVYFTADWCVSCKVNERVALASKSVGDGFTERDIKVIEGDWTSQDPIITEWLQKFGRIGVPLYLYYPRGSSINDPIILPQVLTPGLVLDATSPSQDRASLYKPEIRRARVNDGSAERG
ncbi:MAG: protein-disulfide reductase DsbD domain-containing protein [Pseudomonadota bacterium]